jgi:hypothetical protein
MKAKLAWIALVAAMPAIAHAGAKIGEAKRALDEVRYDDAQRLLVAAIKEGGNSAAEMKQIYELSASAAVVLGQADAGEQYYRRWLALDPAAQLPDSVSPKLRAPFVAAQAEMAAKGAIAISALFVDNAVDVQIVSDPLAMVRGACAITGGALVPFDAQGRARLTAVDARVAVCDESGNRLVEVNVSVPAPLPPPLPQPRVVAEKPLWIARPSTWFILGGVSVPASLILLGLTLQSGNDGNTSTGLIIATSITGGVAVGSLIAGTILLLGRDDQPHVAAAPTRGGATLSVVGHF